MAQTRSSSCRKPNQQPRTPPAFPARTHPPTCLLSPPLRLFMACSSQYLQCPCSRPDSAPPTRPGVPLHEEGGQDRRAPWKHPPDVGSEAQVVPARAWPVRLPPVPRDQQVGVAPVHARLLAVGAVVRGQPLPTLHPHLPRLRCTPTLGALRPVVLLDARSSRARRPSHARTSATPLPT
jgi:hypothetical protein